MPITNHFHLPTGHVDGASLPNDVLKDFDIPSDANIEPDLNELQLMILALLSSPARKLDLCAITQWVSRSVLLSRVDSYSHAGQDYHPHSLLGPASQELRRRPNHR